jgi:hypothetical protein
MSAERQNSEHELMRDTGGAELPTSRRAMLRRGLVKAAPVVATLASGPVAAGTCVIASGFTSVATFQSRNPTGLQNCLGGKSPSAWIGSDWPAGVTKGQLGGGSSLGNGTKFNATFSPHLTLDLSLLAVLSGLAPSPLKTVAAGVVALWLNTLSGLTGGVFSDAYVKALWTNIAGQSPVGCYKPPAGAGPVWTAAQTEDWLALTWS